jgi:hypothetical protein
MKTLTYPRIGEKAIWETLPNGLPVCVVPKPGYARKFAFFTTRYGGMDMRFQLDGQWLDTPAGIAHYLEHKMFDTADGSAMQDLARGGAEPNAYTSNAVTAYYFDCTEHFYDNLRILLSFVSVPYFTDESVEKEQGIIAQEIGMIEDNPEWQVYRQMMQALYTAPSASPWPGPWRASARSPPRPCTTATRPSIPPPICAWWWWATWTRRRSSGPPGKFCPGKAAP